MPFPCFSMLLLKLIEKTPSKTLQDSYLSMTGTQFQHTFKFHYITLLLFLWLFPSSGVAAIVVDRLFPVSPVSFIALSQSYSLHVPLAHILPPCLWSPSLPFPRYRFRHHSLHYVIFFHPHDVPIPFQSSLCYLSGRLRYFHYYFHFIILH